MTEIKYCKDCAKTNHTHEFQDKEYGKFFRVFNVGDKSGTSVCTVCGSNKKVKK